MSEQSKHTPGPWTYSRMLLTPGTKDRRSGFVVNGPDVTETRLPVRVCDIRTPRGIDGFSEGEANAHLIAAAPELLEALEDVELRLTQARLASGIGRKTTLAQVSFLLTELERIGIVARAAIDKAKGE